MREGLNSGRHAQVTWLVLILLLLLRIPFVTATIQYMPIEDESGAAFYEVGTYFLIAFLIWWERKQLADFHIDSAALFLIIFFRPLQTLILSYWKVNTPLAFPNPHSLMIWAIAIGLILSLWVSGFKPACVSALTFSWLCFGILVGVCISIAQNIGAFQNISTGNASSSMLLSTSLNLFYHLGFAPINEEPLFRGFLWGALRQRKWRAGWILLTQTVLFTSAHIYFAGRYPFMFWVFIPFAGLLFGILAMRSRSIAPSILAHTMINGSAYLLIVNLASLVLH